MDATFIFKESVHDIYDEAVSLFPNDEQEQHEYMVSKIVKIEYTETADEGSGIKSL